MNFMKYLTNQIHWIWDQLWDVKHPYTIIPTKVTKEVYEEILKQNQQNKGRIILRFFNDKDEQITDLYLQTKGFDNRRKTPLALA